MNQIIYKLFAFFKKMHKSADAQTHQCEKSEMRLDALNVKDDMVTVDFKK